MKAVGEPVFLRTLITRGCSLSNFLGVSSRSITWRGNFWAQPVQLAGMGSDSFCSQSFVHQGSKSDRGRHVEKANTAGESRRQRGIIILKAHSDQHGWPLKRYISNKWTLKKEADSLARGQRWRGEVLLSVNSSRLCGKYFLTRTSISLVRSTTEVS